MFKVARCEFCGDYYKTGKLRKVILIEKDYHSVEGQFIESMKERKTTACITCFSKLDDNNPVTKKDNTIASFGAI